MRQAVTTQDFRVVASAEQERQKLGRWFKRADFQPTGLYLHPGKSLEVTLGELPKGVTAQAVIGTPGYGIKDSETESPRSQDLHAGANTIPDSKGGVVWIRVSSDRPHLVGRDVRVTFGDQGVSSIPVFRQGETPPGAWKQMIETSQMKGDRTPVQIVGKRVVLTVWRSSALRYADHDPDAVLREYERILDAENDIAGIGRQQGQDKDSPLPILVSEKNAGNPDTSDFRISLPQYGAEMLTVGGLRKSWGIWHEFGHMQQQISWTPDATVETSVNIYSLAVQRSLGQSSRAIPYNEKAHQFLNNPDPDKKFESNDDFVRLVMWEQLRLAFGDGFFPALHKEARHNGNSALYQGDRQYRKYLMLVASKAAKKDLTDFFTKWGWHPDSDTRDAISALHLPKPDHDPTQIHLTSQVQVTSAVRDADGWMTIRGFAQPGSRLKTTNDPNVGWYDPDGPVYAAADGSFTLKTDRLISGKAAVKSYDPKTDSAISESNHVTPQMRVTSAVRDADGWMTIRGFAQPGSRLKTTNDPNAGWYDPDGPVYAAADGSFTLKTDRLISGKAAVKSYDPKTGSAISESNHVTPQMRVVSAVRDADGWMTIRGFAQPGSRLKTTNDPNAGWYDPDGPVYAAADGSFTLKTDRLISGKAAVKSYDPKTDSAISESNHVTPQMRVVSAVRDADGWMTIRGFAQPGSRLKTTNDPNAGWYDPDGPVYAAADGSFTLKTDRLISGKAAVKSYDPKTDSAISESNHVTPQMRVVSAVRDADGWMTIRGFAQPGSRLKTTNDPNVGWYDPNGPVYAAADGSFTLKTDRLISGKAAVKSYDPKTDSAISESNHVTPQMRVVSAVRDADGWMTIRGFAQPGSRLKTTNDPNVGWYDPNGPVYAAADGSFTLKTDRLISGKAAVKSYDPKTDSAISESNHVTPQMRVVSAVRDAGGWMTIRGFAQPGSRLKTTNDPNVGWYDPEDGNVYAGSDGSFTLRTKRLINGKAAVKSYDPKTDSAISESNHTTVTT